MTETLLDAAWAAAHAPGAPESALRRFYALFADAALCLATEPGADDDAPIKPMVFALSDGPAALCFDDDARLAGFFGAPAAYVALRGAELAGLLADARIALALNLDEGGGGALLGPDAMRFVAEEATRGRLETQELTALRLSPPTGASPALIAALRARVAREAGLIGAAWLARIDGAGLAALIASPAAARRAAEGLSAELARCAAPFMAENDDLRIAALPEAHPALAAAARLGVDLAPPPAPAPETQPAAKKPPILR